MKRNILFMLVSGHGGMINNEYQIINKGAKQYHFTSGELNGTSIYEGVENRKLASVIETLSSWEPELRVVWLNKHTEKDLTLNERVDLVSKYVRENPNEILVLFEIHNNASDVSNRGAGGSGNGFEGFTTVGKTICDDLNRFIINEMQVHRPNCRNRGPKERNFYLIRQIQNRFGNRVSSLLFEYFFFDNQKDVIFNTSTEGIRANAAATVRGFKKFQEWMLEKKD